MNTLAFITTIALLALPALSQETVKPIGTSSTGAYQEGPTTTGKFTCDANGLAAKVDFSNSRTSESLIFTIGGTNPNGSNVEYYRVWKNRYGTGMSPTNDYYLFQQNPDDPDTFTWVKYWCQGFYPNGTPWGSNLTGAGTVTYP